jgi:N-acetylneuraminic acid mutarotase
MIGLFPEGSPMIVTIKLLRASLVALVAATLLTSVAHAQKWSTLAPFPEPAEEVWGAAAGGKLYVFGGLAPGWKPKALVYEYDPGGDSWTKKRSMPLASHHVAAAELNGKIYMFGGFKYPDAGKPGWQPIDNAWEYDPAADTWKALAPMPGRRGAAVAVAHGGKIYVIGGASQHPGSKEPFVHPARPHRSLGTNEVYDPATNTWEARNPMPTARNHAAIGMVDNKIYVIGGRVGAVFITGGGRGVDLVEEYDPATDQWGRLQASMPTARSALAWGVHGGKIYVAGGEHQDTRGLTAFRVIEAFDPVANTWTVMPSMQFPRHGHAGAVIGNRLHVVSGDVQSALSGAVVHVDFHHALELPSR